MNRQELIAAMERTAERKVTAVDSVKEWGMVYVRLLTVEEVDEQTADTRAATETDADGNVIKRDRTRFARAAARALCDEKGDPIFDPHKPEDIALLAKQPWKLLRQVLESSDKLEEGTVEKGTETGKD